MLTEKENKILRSISAYEASDHIPKITDLGIRVAGSESARKTEQYLADYFKGLGLEVVIDEFEEVCFVPSGSSIGITEPDDIKIVGQPMMFCAGTSEAGITAEVIYAGTGKEAEIANRDVAGKIVMFDRDSSIVTDCFYGEVNAAAKRGAVGAIMVNFDKWPFIGTLESGYYDPAKRLLPVEPENIPVMCIGAEDGIKIKHLLEKSTVKINIMIDAFLGKRPHSNVRAFIPGTTEPDKKILFIGHLDTEANYGSNDNASGLAILLELARVLSKNPMEKTVEIMPVGCEEIYSLGSYHYCNMHKDELDKIVCVINIDMVGVGGDLLIMTGGNWIEKDVMTPEWLYKEIKAAADELNYKTVFSFNEIGTSDEGRFNDAGVPAVFLWKETDDHYHSLWDQPKYVDPNNLKVIAEISCLAAMRISANK